jgi:hypothetical protein
VVRLGSARALVSVLGVLVRFAAVVCLGAAIAGAQEFAWPPSTPEGESRIDHTRKVLSCNGTGCELTVARTEGELISVLARVPSPLITGGLEAVATFQDKPGGPQSEASGRPSGQVQQMRFTSGFHLILGGCFGGDLPTGPSPATSNVR